MKKTSKGILKKSDILMVKCYNDGYYYHYDYNNKGQDADNQQPH